MDWLNVTAEQGLAGLFAGSFLAATLLPGGSEALLWGFLKIHPEQALTAVLLAGLGNTAGGMTSWACGRFLARWQTREQLPHLHHVQRWGAATLLFSWLPLVGDALCVAAGWLRLHWLPCTLFMAAGKFFRYWLVVQAVLAN